MDGPMVAGEASMRKPMAIALVAAMLLVAAPAQARVVVIDRGRGSGDFPTASASGTVNDPEALIVQVKSRPTNQRVRVFWNLFCHGPSGATAGDYIRRTTTEKQVRMPSPNPDTCTFSATVQLEGSGRVTVVLLASV
jgi:hypothetical protein